MLNKILRLVSDKTFLVYAAIGVSSVSLDLLVYALLTNFVHMSPVLANFISISVGIVNSFALNRSYNFRVKDQWIVRFILFYIVGFLGIILSEVLLIFFHYVISIDPLIAKLLTLPIVLLFQFFINRTISFGSIEQSTRLLKKFAFHWPAYIVFAIVLTCLAVTAKHIPSNFNVIGDSSKYAPDEITHYVFNVEFIKKHKRLPVSGKDDLEAYTNCRDRLSAQVPCLYSYTFYPGASYLINAVSSSVIPKIASVTPQVASRVPSIIYGFIFVVCVYLSAYIITRRRLVSTLILMGIGFIPQFIFVSAYTNLDAHSIGISGLLGLAVTLLLTSSRRKFVIPFLGIVAGGLLPLAKYNFFILIIPTLLLVGYALWQKMITRKDVLKLVAWGLGSFIVLSAGWYLRNYILYHDILGQNFALQEMAKYHSLGMKRYVFDPYAISYLSGNSFFDILFKSFYVNFGMMSFPLEDSRYTVPAFGIVFGACFIGLLLAREWGKSYTKKLLSASGLFSLAIILTLGAVVYNSLVYDFQPQGRYLFPLLICIALFVAYCYRINKRLEVLIFILFSTTLFIAINGIDLFMKVYMNNV